MLRMNEVRSVRFSQPSLLRIETLSQTFRKCNQAFSFCSTKETRLTSSFCNVRSTEIESASLKILTLTTSSTLSSTVSSSSRTSSARQQPSRICKRSHSEKGRTKKHRKTDKTTARSLHLPLLFSLFALTRSSQLIRLFCFVLLSLLSLSRTLPLFSIHDIRRTSSLSHLLSLSFVYLPSRARTASHIYNFSFSHSEKSRAVLLIS